jgi:Domain of unknown function (DUF4365)
MMTPGDIEAELSYAYLHAVAARAGVACQQATRTHDNLGIDACLSISKTFAGTRLTDVSINMQLKATTKPPSERKRWEGRLSYFLGDVDEYDRLRADTSVPLRFLAVLFLPEDPSQWLTHSPEQLALCRCAYWVNLVGAPTSTNDTGQTVYLPASQPLSPIGLLTLFDHVARREVPRYAI